jgi:hypothetical protein
MGALRPSLLTLGVCLLASGCVPHFLEKYRQRMPSQEVKTSSASQKRTNRPAVLMMDPGTVRFHASYDRVWSAMLDVLLKNYNLAIADKTNGLVTTEWDSYYLDDRLHRNKLSLHVKKLGPNIVEMLIYNNVESLSRAGETGTEVWLPIERNKPEIGRVVQNMAISLNLPAPDLPVEMIAAAPKSGSASETARY